MMILFIISAIFIGGSLITKAEASSTYILIGDTQEYRLLDGISNGAMIIGVVLLTTTVIWALSV